MEDLRDDFWKYIDAIKPLITLGELVDIMDKHTKQELLDILKKGFKEESNG